MQPRNNPFDPKSDAEYVEILGLLDANAEHHFAPFLEVASKMAKIREASDNIQNQINEFGLGVYELNAEIATQPINHTVLNKEYKHLVNKCAELKKLIIQRKAENLDVLPIFDTKEVQIRLGGVESLLKQHTLPKDVESYISDLYLKIYRLLIERAKAINNFNETRKSLEERLPMQLTEYKQLQGQLAEIKKTLRDMLVKSIEDKKNPKAPEQAVSSSSPVQAQNIQPIEAASNVHARNSSVHPSSLFNQQQPNQQQASRAKNDPQINEDHKHKGGKCGPGCSIM
ncbi:MAG: hypothetical protein P4M12_02845 [Gammaproteobacteria bacterium]|nr:hypothetical protein [Gammaproteobacteria bacterium]